MTRSEEEQLQRMLAMGRPSTANRGPQPIAEILSRLMARRGYAQEQMSLEWGAIWETVAGSQANHSRPGKFTRGALEIIVRNSAVLQELTFRKKQLLQAVREQVPHVPVRDLRFRVGEVS
jgi:predicted nucleic acid-binding Zn ribbon protein